MEALRDKNGLTEEEFLARYRPGDYPRPSMTVDMLIFAAPGLSSRLAGGGRMSSEDRQHYLGGRALRILMVRRGGHPCLGRYALPGGFVEPRETVMEAARRELLEETHVEGVPLQQLYTFSKPGRDPRTWVMSCAHLAVLDTDQIPAEAGDDASDARWFSVALTRREGSRPGLFHYELRLEGGDQVLSSSLECPLRFDEGSCLAKNSQGLAFDHGAMILCGLKELFHI